MHESVECPYCEQENDMTDGTVDLPSDHRFEHECENCGQEFEVFVEFEPSYGASKIERANCEKCGMETREPCRRGKVFPLPKSVSENVICHSCFLLGHNVDYERERC